MLDINLYISATCKGHPRQNLKGRTSLISSLFQSLPLTVADSSWRIPMIVWSLQQASWSTLLAGICFRKPSFA